MSKSLILFVFLVFSHIASAVDDKAPASVIKIGEVGSMTGTEATFGMSTHQGIQLAVEEANAAGGILGKKLEVISLDDQGKPEEAATAVTKLITQSKVVAILGEVASTRSLAMAPIAQKYKIPMISPSSTSPKVTETGDQIFRVCFIDPFQGTVMARFALDSLKINKVAILRDVKSDYSIGLANFFTEVFKKGGGEIVTELSYSGGDTDFKSQLTSIRAAIKDKGVQAIFVPGYYTEVGLIARQAKELGIKLGAEKNEVKLLGGDGWDSPVLLKVGGKSMEGAFFSNHYSIEDKAAYVQDFIARFKKKYGSTPDGLAAMGYDAAIVLIDAMNRAKSAEPKAIRDALSKTKDFQGVTGKITIDKDRNAQKSAVVLKIVKGVYKYETTINPG